MKTYLTQSSSYGIVLIDFLKKHKVFLVYLPLGVYWMILFIATSIPTEYIPAVGVSDKFNHFFAYLGLSVLLYFSFNLQTKYEVMNKYPASLTIIIAAIYGAFDELHQMLIPGRSAELLDWVADFIGALAGVLIARFLYKIFSKDRSAQKMPN